MSTPRETAAEALWFAWGCEDTVADHSYPARRALESLADHREGIARVLLNADAVNEKNWNWDVAEEYDRDSYRHQADAVLAYLTEAQR